MLRPKAKAPRPCNTLRLVQKNHRSLWRIHIPQFSSPETEWMGGCLTKTRCIIAKASVNIEQGKAHRSDSVSVFDVGIWNCKNTYIPKLNIDTQNYQTISELTYSKTLLASILNFQGAELFLPLTLYLFPFFFPYVFSPYGKSRRRRFLRQEPRQETDPRPVV